MHVFLLTIDAPADFSGISLNITNQVVDIHINHVAFSNQPTKLFTYI